MKISGNLVLSALQQLKSEWRVAVSLAVLPVLALILSDFTSFNINGFEREAQPLLPGAIIWGIVWFLIFIVAFTLMAVGWHRMLIRRESPRYAALARSPWRIMRYAVDWLILGLLIGVVSMIILMPLMFSNLQQAMPFNDGIRLGENVVMIVAPYVIAGIMVLRLGLGLVATATDEERISFRASWKKTRDHSAEVVMAGLWLGVLAVIVFLPNEILLSSRGAAIAHGVNMMAFDTVSILWHAIGAVALAMMEVALLTELYRRVSRGVQVQIVSA